MDEFRILGSLEFLRDGTPVPVKGRHQPRILAMLLLECGRTVTVSKLSEVLWDGEPPDTARRQVRNYVAALRRTLAAPGADPVAVVGEGYRLEVTDAQVDSRRFAELCRLARDDIQAGRHAEAASLLDEALDLWRGPVLAGLTGQVFASAAERLNDARLAAIEDRAEARLNLGRHEDVVAELRDVLVANPFRQRLAEQLMLALYRCGGVTEALEVFTGLRTRMGNELGIEPGPRVRDLQVQILREDSALEPPRAEAAPAPPAARSSQPTVPAQLPADVSTFTGRDAELAALDNLVDTDVRAVSLISGGGGVGKTALAVHWGWRCRHRFPGGQLYINLRGFDNGEPVEPDDALPRLLRALGVAESEIPVNTDEASALYRSIMNERRVLVLLDNARTVDQVRPLLPGGTGSLAIVTSRNRLMSLIAIDDAKLVDLDVLQPRESLDLLSGLIGTERVYAELDSARRLAQLCGHSPLALRITIANMVSRPEISMADFVTELDSAAGLELLEIEGDPQSAVTATFELSLRALDQHARELFLRLGLIPGEDFPKALAVAASGLAEAAAGRLLRSLITAHLLEEPTPQRYRFHDLVKIFVRTRAEATLDRSESSALDDRIVEWYYRNAQRLGHADIPNVVATCAQLNAHPRLWQVATALTTASELGNNNEAARRQCEIALRSAEAHDDKQGQARMLSILGALHNALGDPDSGIALARQAVVMAENNVEPDVYGSLCGRLGLQLLRAGEAGEAEQWLVSGMRSAEQVGDRGVEQIRALNLANLHRVLGSYPQAVDDLDRVVELAEHAKSVFPHVGSLICRATIDNDLGRYTAAQQWAREGLDLAREHHSLRQIGFALQQLGRAEAGCGRADRARSVVVESVDLSARNGLINVEHQGLIQLAELDSDFGDQSSALDWLGQTAAVDPVRSSRTYTGERKRVESKICLRSGGHRRAAELGSEAAAVFAAMPFLVRHAETLTILADAYEGLGATADAGEARAEAFDIFTRLGVRETALRSGRLDVRRR